MPDPELEKKIAELNAEVKQLTIHRDDLQRAREAEQSQVDRYIDLANQKAELEREIAELEGSDDDDGGSDGEE